MCYHREIRHFTAATSDFTMASPHELIITGARQNNLKNVWIGDSTGCRSEAAEAEARRRVLASEDDAGVPFAVR